MPSEEIHPEYNGAHAGHGFLHRSIESRLLTLEEFVKQARVSQNDQLVQMREIKWILLFFFVLALPRFVESIKGMMIH